MRLIDADKLIDDYNKSDGTISDLMELILDAAEEATPPNDPLTLDELREMDGEPVWVVQISGKLRPFWMLVGTEDESAASRLYSAMFEDYGTEWLAYRRRPEGD